MDTATKATHTPGPWTLRPCSHGGQLLERGTTADGRFTHPQHSLQIVPDEDAHLIAAAPDLLAVLHECAELLDDYSDVNDGDDGRPVANRAMSLLQTVEAAIAKAEGK